MIKRNFYTITTFLQRFCIWRLVLFADLPKKGRLMHPAPLSPQRKHKCHNILANRFIKNPLKSRRDSKECLPHPIPPKKATPRAKPPAGRAGSLLRNRTTNFVYNYHRGQVRVTHARGRISLRRQASGSGRARTLYPIEGRGRSGCRAFTTGGQTGTGGSRETRRGTPVGASEFSGRDQAKIRKIDQFREWLETPQAVLS